MVSVDDYAAIAALNLDPIKVKLMRPDDGKGWTREQADLVEVEYRRFLYLMKMFPHEPTAPLVDVDTFWHYHILDTMNYAADCEQVFGYFLHHFPYVGLRGKEDEQTLVQMGQRMQVLYEQTFGESYIRTIADRSPRLRSKKQPAFCTKIGAQPAFCTRVEPQPAYCTRVEAQPAFCTRVEANAAERSNSGNECAPDGTRIGRMRTDRPALASV